MMSKRLFSDEPNAPKPLKELSGKMQKARMGNFGKTKKSYRELPQKPQGFRQKPSDALYEQA